MTGDQHPKSTATIVAGVVVFVSSLAALVALELNGNDSTVVLTLAGPVVAALLVTGHISNQNSQQNVKLEKIESQTNGVMDARIKTQTLAALAEAGVITASPAGPLPAPGLSDEPAPRHAAN